MHWSLLESLSVADQQAFLATSRRRRFRRNEVVFYDQDPGDTLHLIVKGHFAARIVTPLGDVATIRVFGPGQFFGELAVLSPAPRTGTIVSIDESETLGVHRVDIERLRRANPQVDRALTEALITEIRRLAQALVDALYVPVDQRLWRRLHELLGMYARGDPTVIGITQDDLAQLAGTTRPTANRVLQDGVRDGILRLARGRIEVLDDASLKQRAE